jgi:nicotinate-nucleotide adenylyltransferase
MSLYALKRLHLDQVWWLVSPQNPLKTKQSMKPLRERFVKARHIARHPKIKVTDLESDLGTVYTVDTLKALKKRFPGAHFIWLMGADNLRQIPSWSRWQEIFALMPVAVFRRPAYAVGRRSGKASQCFDRYWLSLKQSRSLARHPAPVWSILDNPLNFLSATDIRRQLKEG